jgi:hypothetical protein
MVLIKPSPELHAHANIGRMQAFMQREGEQRAPREVIKQLRRSPSLEQDREPSADGDENWQEVETTPTEPESESQPSTPLASPSASLRRFSFFDTVKAAKKALPNLNQPRNAKSSGAWTEPQPWQISRAIEQKDVMFLMDVRDRAFHVGWMGFFTSTGRTSPFPKTDS